MDNELRASLRQAELSGDYQRLYGLLLRAGRTDEAQKLFLDHPIQVECTIRYRYEANWSQRLLQSQHDAPVAYGWTEDEVIEAVIEKKIGASRIHSVLRIPVYRVLGNDMTRPYYQAPLPHISLTDAELFQFKKKVRQHPRYMKGASAQQRELAKEADEYDERRALQRSETERQQLAAQQRKKMGREQFEASSPRHHAEAWALWQEHHNKSRNDFAKAIKDHPVAFVLFQLRHRQDEFGSPVTREVFDTAWTESYERRLRFFMRGRGNSE